MSSMYNIFIIVSSFVSPYSLDLTVFPSRNTVNLPHQENGFRWWNSASQVPESRHSLHEKTSTSSTNNFLLESYGFVPGSVGVLHNYASTSVRTECIAAL
eukprot:gb/GECG01016174.1/.p1 GENE.gb/GECG01016174.1/~~gb/GECG01016174.1/.p1  ORF type:complete len:100 (+),score=10.30 gb/GECG01016174.1/:1-300(+)